MRCPISFFDVTPPGRILQRFSRDMDECELKYHIIEDELYSFGVLIGVIRNTFQIENILWEVMENSPIT
jgi:hypothetical protein